MLNTSSVLKTFATRYPFLFAFLCFLLVFVILSIDTYLVPKNAVIAQWSSIILLIILFLLAFALLFSLGWIRAAGFTAPANWRDMHVFWLPVLITLIIMVPLLFELPRASSFGAVTYAALFALLTGLNEETLSRGLILQILRPYGPVRAALISAIFFGLLHGNNFAYLPLPVVVAQIIWAMLLGFAYAALRLRTGTIWPLIILHACSDLAVDVNLYASPQKNVTGAVSSPGLLLASLGGLLLLTLILAIYGFFLLHSQKQVDSTLQTEGVAETK
jgi:membrane protease YdiL (CAAX protease family)